MVRQITPYEEDFKTEWTLKQEVVWFNGFTKLLIMPILSND